jgi:hypothetical protein
MSLTHSSATDKRGESGNTATAGGASEHGKNLEPEAAVVPNARHNRSANKINGLLSPGALSILVHFSYNYFHRSDILCVFKRY